MQNSPPAGLLGVTFGLIAPQMNKVHSQSCEPVQAGSVQSVVLCAASTLCLYTGTFVIEEYIRPGSQTVPQRRQLAGQIRCFCSLVQQQTQFPDLIPFLIDASSKEAVNNVTPRKWSWLTR